MLQIKETIGSIEKRFGVKVQFEFAAAHHIRGYDGECSRPHGHNFKVEVEVTSSQLNKIGLSIDFNYLNKIMEGLIGRLDHQDLNQIEPFQSKINPTAETLAQYFFEKISPEIEVAQDLNDICLQKVTVWENERSSASYGHI